MVSIGKSVDDTFGKLNLIRAALYVESFGTTMTRDRETVANKHTISATGVWRSPWSTNLTGSKRLIRPLNGRLGVGTTVETQKKGLPESTRTASGMV